MHILFKFIAFLRRFLIFLFKILKFVKKFNMSKFKIVNLFDKLFITICIFLVFFAWINFYIKNLFATFFLSLILTAGTYFVIFYFYKHKQTKTLISNQKSEDNKKTFLAFCLLNKNEQFEILKQTFCIEKIVGDFYVCKNDFYFVFNQNETLCENDFFNIIASARLYDFDKLNIICNNAKKLNLNILKGKNINIICKEKLVELFDENHTKINVENLNLEPEKFCWKDFAINFFSEKKAKSYFACGLVLLFSSLILPYNFYYIIFGSMLMLFAVICKILPKFNLH